MCGIAGWIAKGVDPDDVRDAIGRASETLVHRGPDDHGAVLLSERGWQVALAARRLSILDLSPAGHQPMSDPATGNWVVHNGEIYNFRLLREELLASGQKFQSESDTEVLLAAYKTWDLEAMLRRLRGMFAFALWDAERHRLILARDRIGVKPLYYALGTKGLAFASEVRALLASKIVPPRLSPLGLAGFLAAGAVPDPLTLIEGVSALPAGTVGIFESGALQLHHYWSLSDAFAAPKFTMKRSDVLGQLRHLLQESVALRLISDAPIGIFLSGGVDSTSLLALARESSSADLRTVSVIFREREYSEEAYVREAVQRYETKHVNLRLTADAFRASLPDALAAMDQPTFDGVNTYVVSAAARSAGLKVALSGIGGDELFGGYPSFRAAPQLARLRRLSPGTRNLLAWALSLRSSSDRNEKIVRWLRSHDGDDGPVLLLRELFGPSSRARIAPGLPSPPTGTLVRGSSTDDVSYMELSHYLLNVLLRDADVMGMARSIEIREPILDHHLIEFVARIPMELKRGPGLKPLLLSAVGDGLPTAIRRRKKMGFTLPFDTWMRGPLRAAVEDVLLDRNGGGALTDVLSGPAVGEVWRQFLRGETSWTRPWALYALKQWVARHLT